MGLVVTRKLYESLIISTPDRPDRVIEIQITSIKGNQVKLHIVNPKSDIKVDPTQGKRKPVCES